MRSAIRRHRRILLPVFFVATVFLAGFAAGTVNTAIQAQNATGLSEADNQAFQPLWEALNLIRDNYVDDVPLETLVNGALSGLADSLNDPYSGYMTPDDYAARSAELAGRIEGIGVVIQTNPDSGQVIVVDTLEGGPAERAGIQPGDIFDKVDGDLVADMSQDELATHVRGPEGTTVVVTMERNGELIDFSVVRESIQIPNIETEIVGSDIAYIRLNGFTPDARRDLDAAIQELDVNSRSGLIFDLRGNPGGLLDQAIDVASAFIPSGVIVREAFTDADVQVYDANGNTAGITVPIVLLVNESSASASEIVAGALQDYGAATLIGTTTFGKGTVQTWQPLSNGGGLRLTIARWLTPDNNWIHEVGITPDIVVEWTRGATEDEADPQLERAVEFLHAEQPAAPAELDSAA